MRTERTGRPSRCAPSGGRPDKQRETEEEGFRQQIDSWVEADHSMNERRLQGLETFSPQPNLENVKNLKIYQY
ncbi:Protein of unknown function [Gryllus bimaculatus]|nr:Protein of unknown function [Gryllus bimaculatus]